LIADLGVALTKLAARAVLGRAHCRLLGLCQAQSLARE
jgi:hypothetical protein